MVQRHVTFFMSIAPVLVVKTVVHSVRAMQIVLEVGSVTRMIVHARKFVMMSVVPPVV
jgi:hypothetical protein